MGKEIPIVEAERIAKEYGYEQVVILATKKLKNKNWFDGWTTTFNIDKTRCAFLGKVAAMLHNNLRSFYSNEKMAMSYYQDMLGHQQKGATHE